MAFVVMVSPSFPMALKVKQQACSSSSLLTAPIPRSETHPSFLRHGWLRVTREGRPQEERLAVSSRAADQLRGNSSHQHTWGSWGSTARGRNVAPGPYTAMPDPAHTQRCRCVSSFYQVSYYHGNAPNLRFRTV